MLKGGVKLALFIGPVIPVPATEAMMRALESVQVTSGVGENDNGFELRFRLDRNSPLNALMIAAGEVGPVIRVIIAVTLNNIPHVLFDGVITSFQISPNSETGANTLILQGKDLTAVLKLIDFTGIPYPAMPSAARVALILAKYATFGIVPITIPAVSVDIPIPTERIPSHQGTDFAYIKSLADEAGYIFYIEPGAAPGMNIGYWGPTVRISVPQPALTVNMDLFTNVESLNFQMNNDEATTYVVRIQEPITKMTIPIPIPDVGILNPPLGLIPPMRARTEPIPDSAKKNPLLAALFGMSRTASASDVVSGNGNLDVLRYGHVLRARQLVGVRGAGLAFDGLYYVNQVSHTVKAGEFKTSFRLTRNAIVSNVPIVAT